MDRSKLVLRVLHWSTLRFLTLTGAFAMTIGFFMILPVIQAITDEPPADLVVVEVETANLPPPPAPPEQEPEPEPEEDKPRPELAEETQPLDLAQLEIALDPGAGALGFGGDFALNLNAVGASAQDVRELFSMADLDQKPRVIFQPGPRISTELRKGGGGTVFVLFIVDERGRVQAPIVQSSPNAIYERPAIDAIKRWRFEPGKRNGQPVRFRLRVPFTFPKG